MNNSNKNDTVPQDSFLRKSVIIFLSMMSVLYLAFAAIYTQGNAVIMQSLMSICSIQHIVWLVLFIINRQIPIQPMVTMYITYAIVAIYPFACIFWNDTQPMVFLWYFCTIIGALIFDTKHIIQYVAMTIISVVAVFLFAAMLFPHEHFTQEVLLQSSMLTVLAGIFLSGFFVIVFILQINRQRVEAEEQMQETVKVAETNEKEKALYREIMRYMEESKCFANPDFSAQMLAKAIGSNYNYVSKAISTCCETGDFRALLNQFRIAYAKEMLDDGAMSKYTLDHIFTKAGYNHRSTFNTAFRNIVGMTPSDYIAQKNAATASATSVRNHTVS